MTTLIICLASCQPATKKTMSLYSKTELPVPVANKKAKELSIHGDTRLDPYYWLNERENPEVIDYLQAENDYKDQLMSHLSGFEDKLFHEIIERIKQTDVTVPFRHNGYYYLTRYEEGGEHPIYARKKGSEQSEEEIMLNVNQLAKPFDYYQIGGRSVSPDNKYLAYGEDTLSRRIYTIRFKDLTTDEILEDVITNTTGSAVWANDNRTIFYTRKDPTLRAYKIYRHVLGTNPEEDVEIYHEQDETFSTYVYKSKSEKYIIIGSFATLSSEFQLLEADNPMGAFRVFHPREENHEYSISHNQDRFLIRTNWKAENFRLMETMEGQTEKEAWKEVIPRRQQVLLEGVDVFDDHLVLLERIDGITQVRVISNDDSDHYVQFGEDAFTAYTTSNFEVETNTVRIGYTSLTTPASIYDYNMKSRQLTMRKQEEVIGDFHPDDYQSERHMITARDGTKVPLSLVYKKNYVKDGTQPLLLYGYGSYGYSTDPGFRSPRLSLLDRGFAFAIAHIRGGQELGRRWYEDGKLLKKKNTFTDFVDCAQWLVDQKYTGTDQLFAMGGSAGGLLMGAVTNMAPHLFKGIVSAVPFVDVITTMLDENIPLTTGEFDEWGNPNNKLFYDYIKSYSPYDNIVATDYPALLVTTGLHDSQVQYWEPAKYVAKIRSLKTDQNPLLLYTNMETGHSGPSGRFERHRETAMEYAFLLDLAGRADLAD